MRGLLALGVSGGLLPCPTALVVLLAAVSFHNVALGMVLVAAFSVGLAIVLTGIGLAFVFGQRALTALCKIYTVHYQAGGRYAPFVGVRGIPPTVAMVMASQMLKAVNVELFELGMWQAWSRG